MVKCKTAENGHDYSDKEMEPLHSLQDEIMIKKIGLNFFFNFGLETNF